MPLNENEKVIQLLEKFHSAMLVTRTEAGDTRARPMAIAKVEGSRIWLLTGKQTSKADEIANDARVTLTMQSASEFLSVTGRAELRTDRAKIDELWNAAFKVWFPKGKDDPDLSLISVTLDEAEYWDNAGVNKVKYLVEAAKALLTGTTPVTDSDQHARVRM